MSIHAKLNPEAQARLATQRRNSTVMSGVIAFLVIAIIGLLLGLFLLPNLVTETPTIVTYQANEAQEKDPEPQKVKSAIQRKPTSPASSQVQVIASATSSAVSIPVPDVDMTSEAVDFGDAQDFGTGWGADLGIGGGGGGASFFNQSVKADRIAYVIDYSQSMKGAKDRLMREELTKSIGGLKAGSRFQMIFFAGAAWVAGSEVKGMNQVTGDRGKVYKWTNKGIHDFEPVGKMQEADWLAMSPKEMSGALKIIGETPLVGGTDWRNPIKMALEMNPPPQLIFFMTDGASGGGMQEIVDDLSKRAKKVGTIINTVVLIEPKAKEYMFQLADNTGGVFTIVDQDGKSEAVTSLEKSKKKK